MANELKAYLGTDPYIFVSYAHKDWELVAPFIAALQEHYNVWFDEGLTPGERYDEEIISKIEACGVFLYLITEESLSSEYCKKEVKFAIKKKKPFINVLLADAKLPSWFEFEDLDSYQYLSLFKFDSLKKAIADLKRKNSALQAAEKRPTSSNLLFRPNGDGTCSVVGITDLTVTTVFVPSVSPTGAPVTHIGPEAFWECLNLTSATISCGLLSIGERAFASCEKLTSITLPGGMKNIGAWAFAGCVKLKSITLPNTLRNIEERAFDSCFSLSNITLPDGVMHIGEQAFRDCSSLTSIMIPGRLRGIGNGVFSGCDNLATVSVAKENCFFHSKGNCLIHTRSKTLVAGCRSSVIPDDGSVENIGSYAFSNCKNLVSIAIPNSVTTIEEGTFSGCDNLKSVTLPNSVTEIGEWAFAGCTGLPSVVLPDSMTWIDSNLFSGCTNLTSIVIPYSIIGIDHTAFQDCYSLTSIIYTGTKAQWDAIEKAKDWDENTEFYIIHCSDGNIEKQ